MENTQDEILWDLSRYMKRMDSELAYGNRLYLINSVKDAKSELATWLDHDQATTQYNKHIELTSNARKSNQLSYINFITQQEQHVSYLNANADMFPPNVFVFLLDKFNEDIRSYRKRLKENDEAFHAITFDDYVNDKLQFLNKRIAEMEKRIAFLLEFEKELDTPKFEQMKQILGWDSSKYTK